MIPAGKLAWARTPCENRWRKLFFGPKSLIIVARWWLHKTSAGLFGRRLNARARLW